MKSKHFGKIVNPLVEAETQANELNGEMKALMKHGSECGAYADAQVIAVSTLAILKNVRKALAAAREAAHYTIERTCGDLKDD